MPTAPDAALDWNEVDGVLFDLDGVLTPTATIHERAWKLTFDGVLERRAAADPHESFVPFSDDDYLRFVDGKPRYDGVRSFLASRDITLPEGRPDDAAGDTTVCAVGNGKNDRFQDVLRTDGIAAYPGSLSLLDWLAERETPVAVVSSSRNAPEVLETSGLAARFVVVVDGAVTASLGLAGKPAPDMFLEAARQLGVEPARTLVVEDAIAGVAAGRAGGCVVVGVDRGAGVAALRDAGADTVVADLAELLPAVGPITRTGADAPMRP